MSGWQENSIKVIKRYSFYVICNKETGEYMSDENYVADEIEDAYKHRFKDMVEVEISFYNEPEKFETRLITVTYEEER